MDLFDWVRTAPPPETVRQSSAKPKTDTEEEEAETEAGADAEPNEKFSTPSPIQLVLSPTLNADEELETEKVEKKVRRASAPPSPAIDKAKKLEMKEDEAVEDDDKPMKTVSICLKDSDEDREDDEDEKDKDDKETAEEKNGEKQELQPPKTKAEQKMFLDAAAPSKDKPISPEGTKRCMVRIKRLSQSEIRRLTQQKVKRGRPRKSSSSESLQSDGGAVPTKKAKVSLGKIATKAAWLHNGSKNQSMPKPKRAHTPPPSYKKSPKRARTDGVNKMLVEQFGARFFNCFVKLKRLTGTNSSTPKRTNRKSKSKLSVSFSEAVEILGSKPRYSSTPRQPSKLNTSVPTRLQRVDATGAVVEDIDLDTTLKSSGSSSGAKKRGRPSSCNGGKRTDSKHKRPIVRVPVTDLASLRIDDSQEEDTGNEGGDEYIVPNEMPACNTSDVRRSGTPKPSKKVTVTTTVSDDECTDGPAEKVEPKTKSQTEAKTQPQEEAKKQSQQEAKIRAESTPEKEAKPESDTESASKAEKDLKPELEPEQEPKPKPDSNSEPEREPEPSCSYKRTDDESKDKEKDRDIDKDKDMDTMELLDDEKESLDDNKLQIVEIDESKSDDLELKLKTSSDIEKEDSETQESREKTPLPSAFPEDSSNDDILEIRTSLDTPTSLHMESPVSEISFKSANKEDSSDAEPNIVPHRRTPSTPSPSSSGQLSNDPDALPTDPTPPVVAASSSNASQRAAGTTTSTSRLADSPIVEIPSLDDEELGRLVDMGASPSGSSALDK